MSLLTPVSIFAQNKFLPVMDSSLICSCNEGRMMRTAPDAHGYSHEALAIYYIVEEMPKPMISKTEIESFLEKNIQLNAQEKNYEGNIYLQCVVNCKGEAGDFQILHCPPEFVNVGCRISNFFQENITSWNSPVQRDREVDILTQVKVNINKGSFKVVAPFY